MENYLLRRRELRLTVKSTFSIFIFLFYSCYINFYDVSQSRQVISGAINRDRCRYFLRSSLNIWSTLWILQDIPLRSPSWFRKKSNRFAWVRLLLWLTKGRHYLPVMKRKKLYIRAGPMILTVLTLHVLFPSAPSVQMLLSWRGIKSPISPNLSRQTRLVKVGTVTSRKTGLIDVASVKRV